MVALPTLCLLAVLSVTPDAVLLEFYSPQCGPCRAMQPTIDRLTQEGYPIRQVNVEQDRELAQRFRITAVPTTVLVVNDQEVTRLEGMRSYVDLKNLFAHAAQTAQQAEAAAEEYTVRGQSPEARRGLGLFSKLSGRGAADPGTPPVSLPANPPAAGQNLGQDHAFAPHARPEPASQPVRPAAMEVPQPSSAAPAEVAAGSPAERALAATVRLKVEDPAGVSFGTGTIIDTLEDEALVVTCGHIFRDSQGKGKISVDLHTASGGSPVPGQLISFDLTRDIALVSIRPGVKVTPVPVAPSADRVVEGTRVFSIGCDHGRDPSVHECRITALNKFVGPPYYSASGAPVEGRSGGGLFLADGTLIGICNAADHHDNEGLYAALPTIHWQLDMIGQSAIYQKQREPQREHSAVASAPRNELPAHSPAVQDEGMVPVTPPGDNDTELLLFVRSKSQPNRPAQPFIIDRPTPELMRMLEAAATQAGSVELSAAPQNTGLRTALGNDMPIVRGQSQR